MTQGLRNSIATALLSLIPAASAVATEPFVHWEDLVGDRTIREMGDGNLAHVNSNALPDIVSLTFTAWEAEHPATDPYTGCAVDPINAHLVRIDLKLMGLFQPPGPLGVGGTPYNPYRFGDRPVYGFIEIDVDDDINSGGELQEIALFRYLANVARFGGLPTGPLGARAAISADDYDGNISIGRQFERSGAEMALTLCGCFNPTLVQEIGNNDGKMDEGETFIVRGRFFERMPSLAEYSGAFGGSDFGLYDPLVNLRFSHDVASHTTTITLVFPLDKFGAAALAGQPVQNLDFFVGNHTSVHELLRDLVFAASGAFGSIFSDPAMLLLTQKWISSNFPSNIPQLEQELVQYLDPTRWKAHVIVGTAYAVPQEALYVWTDVGFNARFADVNADGLSNGDDQALLDSFIATADGGPQDADGLVNNVVQIQDFGQNFSLYDLTYDGIVSDDDLAVYDVAQVADLSGDGFVNGLDLAMLLANWGYCEGCPADFNGDSHVNGVDLAMLLANWAP